MSVGELAMTPRISLVAVCCSSDSLQIARPRLEFLEQTDVLDGDDGLVGESLEEGNLLLCKPANLLLANDNHTNGNTLSRMSGAASTVRMPPRSDLA